MSRGAAQISLEYLLTLSISVGALLFILPVASRVEGASREAFMKSELDSLSRELSISCEEVMVSGRGSTESIKTNLNVSISTLNGELIVSSEGKESRSPWMGCELNEESFKAGESIVVSRPG